MDGFWVWLLRKDSLNEARWYLRNFPEAHLFGSVDELSRYAYEFQFRARSFRISAFFLVVAIIGTAAIRFWVERYLPKLALPGSLNEAVWACVPGLIFGLGLPYGLRRQIAVVMRRKLIALCVPVCIKCGYCLRGNVSDKCPECGRKIEAVIRRMIEIDVEREKSPPDRAN